MSGAPRASERFGRRGFGGALGLRAKLLLLTLIPLLPLGALNVVQLLRLSALQDRETEQRVDQVQDLWSTRLQRLDGLLQRSLRSLAESKPVEQALRRNHWARAREALQRVTVADAALRAFVVDGDGRLLADSRSARFDQDLSGSPLVARALRGEEVWGLQDFEGLPIWGGLLPLRVGQAVEGVVWVGLPLEPALLRGFARQARAAAVLELPGSGGLLTSLGLSSPPALPREGPARSLAVGGRRLRLRPVPLALRGLDAPLPFWLGVDETELEAALRQQLAWQIGLFVALILGILAATLVLAERIVHALRYVVEKMGLLQRGEYEKIDPVVGRDEIAFLGHGFNEMIDGLIERDFVRETFGRYMSTQVARAVLDAPAGLALGGALRHVTVLLCDLRGFTGFSGAHRPEEVVRLLNVWLGGMGEVIERYQGTVIEFLGDAILAVFGAPVGQADDAARAVACGVAMQRAMAEVNRALAREAMPPLRMGIGLATGPVVAGNLGSERRVKYGVVGQPVNLASRVESFTVGGDLLIDAATLAAARATGASVRVGPPRSLRVKGQDESLVLHAVLGLGPPYELEMPEQRVLPLRPPQGQLRATVWLLRGKEVLPEPFDVPVSGLSPDLCEVSLPLALSPGAEVELQLRGAAGETSAGLYAKVLSAAAIPAGGQQRTLLRLTQLPPDDRLLLDLL